MGPHGLIFACFMVSCILGSTVFGYFSSRGTRVEVLAFWNYIAAIGFLWLSARDDFLTRNAAFLGFESCVGFFWPCAMSLRGKYIPEEVRATIMNFFRIPLNIIVVVVLLRVKQLPTASILVFCGFLMFTSAVMQYYLVTQSAKAPEKGYEQVEVQRPAAGESRPSKSTTAGKTTGLIEITQPDSTGD